MNEPKLRMVEGDFTSIECQVVKTDSVEGASGSGIAVGMDMHPAYPALFVTVFGEDVEPLTVILHPAACAFLAAAMHEFGMELVARGQATMSADTTGKPN